jgi:hypothetical protein
MDCHATARNDELSIAFLNIGKVAESRMGYVG